MPDINSLQQNTVTALEKVNNIHYIVNPEEIRKINEDFYKAIHEWEQATQTVLEWEKQTSQDNFNKWYTDLKEEQKSAYTTYKEDKENVIKQDNQELIRLQNEAGTPNFDLYKDMTSRELLYNNNFIKEIQKLILRLGGQNDTKNSLKDGFLWSEKSITRTRIRSIQGYLNKPPYNAWLDTDGLPGNNTLSTLLTVINGKTARETMINEHSAGTLVLQPVFLNWASDRATDTNKQDNKKSWNSGQNNPPKKTTTYPEEPKGDDQKKVKEQQTPVDTEPTLPRKQISNNSETVSKDTPIDQKTRDTLRDTLSKSFQLQLNDNDQKFANLIDLNLSSLTITPWWEAGKRLCKVTIKNQQGLTAVTSIITPQDFVAKDIGGNFTINRDAFEKKIKNEIAEKALDKGFSIIRDYFNPIWPKYYYFEKDYFYSKTDLDWSTKASKSRNNFFMNMSDIRFTDIKLDGKQVKLKIKNLTEASFKYGNTPKDASISIDIMSHFKDNGDLDNKKIQQSLKDALEKKIRDIYPTYFSKPSPQTTPQNKNVNPNTIT